MAKKKSSKAKKKNPKRSAARHPKKKNPKRVAARHPKKKNPRRGAPRHHPKKKNASHRARRHPRRKNPGWSNGKSALVGLAFGAGAALLSSWVNDGPLGNMSPGAKNFALVAEGGAAVYFLENPIHAVGAVVGIFLVPVVGFIYNAMPALANPTPMGSPPADGTTVVVAAVPSMGALHHGAIAALKHYDKAVPQIAALHRGKSGIAALHRGGGISALHRGSGIGAVAVLQPAMSRGFNRYGGSAR